MNQTEMNFIQEAVYTKCNNILKYIADSVNAQMKSEQKKNEKQQKKGGNQNGKATSILDETNENKKRKMARI